MVKRINFINIIITRIREASRAIKEEAVYKVKFAAEKENQSVHVKLRKSILISMCNSIPLAIYSTTSQKREEGEVKNGG